MLNHFSHFKSLVQSCKNVFSVTFSEYVHYFIGSFYWYEHFFVSGVFFEVIIYSVDMFRMQLEFWRTFQFQGAWIVFKPPAIKFSRSRKSLDIFLFVFHRSSMAGMQYHNNHNLDIYLASIVINVIYICRFESQTPVHPMYIIEQLLNQFTGLKYSGDLGLYQFMQKYVSVKGSSSCFSWYQILFLFPPP